MAYHLSLEVCDRCDEMRELSVDEETGDCICDDCDARVGAPLEQGRPPAGGGKAMPPADTPPIPPCKFAHGPLLLNKPRRLADLVSDPRIIKWWKEADGAFAGPDDPRDRSSYWADLADGWRWEETISLHEPTAKDLFDALWSVYCGCGCDMTVEDAKQKAADPYLAEDIPQEGRNMTFRLSPEAAYQVDRWRAQGRPVNLSRIVQDALVKALVAALDVS